jgi:polyhydroxybutyrate depolymerase
MLSFFRYRERSVTIQTGLPHRLWLLAMTLFLLPLSANAADIGEKFTLSHEELERVYYLYAPAPSDKPRPLVIVLHGGGGSPQNIADTTGFSELAKEKDFMVAYPLGSGRFPTWNAGKCCGYAERKDIDDVGFIDKMIADIKTKVKVDNTRIYATGMSNGGMMAYRLACERANVFAAIAPVAGAMNTHRCEPNARPAVMVFHALDDRNVLYDGGIPEKGVRAMASQKPETDASVNEALGFWVKQNYCRSFPGQEDYGEVARLTYFCAEGREVVVNTLKTGGHSWPGGKKGREGADTPNDNVKATEEIWDFFFRHPPTELF